ncbi:MAG: hypothetical protein Q8O57_10875 [Kiritimatiellota bacterium]|nr:hypothetical protein [Kiritimatiellota bacterium]
MADSQSRLSVWKRLGLSFAVMLGVWLLVAWPLPRYVGVGIPAAAHREAADIQHLVPGDHLQFMYYCWLAGDMVAGKTPLFYNLYEFNTGNDRERFEPYAYYIPFSLIYAAAAGLCGQAFGWNLTGFIALWLTYLLTWLLVRRWTRSEWVAAVAALLGIVLPFRWINLFGGSPAGFAMAWIPAIMLGVDLAMREDRVRGGVLAGAALLLASWGDSHVFFFGTLAVPVYGIVAFAGRTDFQWRQGASYRRLVLALLPIGLFAVAAFLFPVLMEGLYRAVTGLAPVAHAIGPRTLREVMLFAPDWQGFCGMNTRGTSAHIYLGVLIPAFIMAGWLALVRRTWGDWRTHGRTLIVLTLVMLAMVVIMFLALGPRGPEHGLLFRICRLIVPPYALIRQPAKIFCLMPSFLAVASAIVLMALVQLRSSRAWHILVPIVFAGIILWDYPRQSNPTISLLEKKQAAYAAVAANATGAVHTAAGQAVPRALVLPLWPGDSHYASIYQYFAAIYRVRMVNGYNPFIKQGYFENVFRRFESVNQGGLSEDQVNGLLGMNVRYILLHENLFPEKVSPFPVTATLRQLLRHPRLELLRQDGSVWAFKIMDSPQTGPAPAWDILIPARRFEMEKTIAERRVTVMISSEAGGRAYVALAETNASLRTTPIRVAAVSNLHWLVRARGQGTLGGALMTDERVTALAPLKVQAEEWTWLNIPVPAFRGFTALSLKLVLQAGAVDLDLSLLTAGPWPWLNPGESLTLPAPIFFHAGYTDLKSGGVVFRRDYDPQGFVLYGPKLPLPRGTYEINIAFTSPAAPGVELGVINLEQNEAIVEGVGAARPVSAIFAGQPASVRWRQYENLPFNLALHYNASADLEIQRITIKRLK